MERRATEVAFALSENINLLGCIGIIPLAKSPDESFTIIDFYINEFPNIPRDLRLNRGENVLRERVPHPHREQALVCLSVSIIQQDEGVVARFSFGQRTK